MNDKQTAVVIIGAITSAIFGGLLLLALIQSVISVFIGHIDSGDDIGWGLLWILFTVMSGIVGAILSGKWARKRYSDSEA
jgi:hypothetical protein